MSGDEVKYASHRLSEALDGVTRHLVAVATSLREAGRIASRGDVAPSSSLFYSPAQGRVGLRLPFNSELLEVIHERDEGEVRHYRLSRPSAGQVSSACVCVSKTTDAAAELVRQIAEAIGESK